MIYGKKKKATRRWRSQEPKEGIGHAQVKSRGRVGAVFLQYEWIDKNMVHRGETDTVYVNLNTTNNSP